MPGPVAVWTGFRVVVAGVTFGRSTRLEAASFSPARASWTRIDPRVPAAHPPAYVAMVATRAGVILWSLWWWTKQNGPRGSELFSGVDVFRLTTGGRWRKFTGRWPQHHTVDQPIFTGHRILLAPGQTWCGICHPPPPFNEHGDLVNPRVLKSGPHER